MRCVFQRAMVAIFLVASLIAPIGTCLQQTHKAGHDCCVPMPASSTAIQNDCCTAKSTLPAMVVAPNLSGSAASNVVMETISTIEISSPSDLPVLAVIPPHSPPPGASILRI
ncbi:MAG: hypothetical protein ABR987_02205 [Terracidiphilus sp.]